MSCPRLCIEDRAFNPMLLSQITCLKVKSRSWFALCQAKLRVEGQVQQSNYQHPLSVLRSGSYMCTVFSRSNQGRGQGHSVSVPQDAVKALKVKLRQEEEVMVKEQQLIICTEIRHLKQENERRKVYG